MPNVKISPIFNDAQFVANAELLAGGKIYTFAANSNTIQQTTYTDNHGDIVNSNPIVLDSSGRMQNSIWLIENLSYQLILTDRANNVITTHNNVTGAPNPAANNLYQSTAFTDPVFYSNDGEPLAGGKLYSYLNNSFTIKIPTYTNSACAIPHTNPIVLSNNGTLPSNIYLDTNKKYNLVLTDSNDVMLKYYNGAYGIAGNVIPSPSVDSLTLNPEPINNTYTNGQEFGFSWTSSNSVGVIWEVYDFIGNQQQPTPIYSGTGNINGSVSNIFAPNTGNFMTVDVAAEGFPGANPLFVGTSRLVFLQAPIPTDPYFANVVLLLHGDGANGGTTFIDSSLDMRTPVFTDRVTTSNEQTLFGQNTIKSLGGRFSGDWSALNYSSNVAFAQTDNFTLEFWIYPLMQNTLAYLFGKDTSTYFNFLGTTLSETGWSDTGPNDYTVNQDTWTYIAISVVEQPLSPGNPTFRFYVNGVMLTEQIITTINLNTPRALGIVSIFGRDDLESFKGYLSEIRYTQGVGRYTTATIPVPTAPWPNS